MQALVPAAAMLAALASGAVADEVPFKAAAAATIPAADAVAAVENLTLGAALSLSLRELHGRPVFQFRLLRDGYVSTANVDATTGRATLHGATLKVSRSGRMLRDEVAAFTHGSSGLGVALELAEKRTGGRAVEAGIVRQQSGPVWEILVVDHGALERVDLDLGQAPP